MRSLPREIWVLLGANVVIALGFGFIAPALPVFAKSFHVSSLAAAFIVSSFALMRLVFAPVGSRLVTKLGERRIYVTGLVIVAVSTFACAFAHQYWQLLLFRALGGVGSTMFTVSALALLIRLAPPEIRGRASGYFSAGFLIGSITGPLIGGLLVGFGLRLPFIVYGVALIVATLVVSTQLRDVGGSPVVDAEADVIEPMTIMEALRLRAYRAVVATNFTQGFVSIGVRVAIVPLLVVDQSGLNADKGAIGLLLALYAAGNVAAITVAGRLSDSLGRKVLIVPGLAIMGGSTMAIGMSSSVIVAGALSFIAGIGSGLYAPTNQAALADVLSTRGRGGSALAAFQMASDVGAVSGPIMAGWIVDSAGYGPAFLIAGIIALVVLAIWLTAAETAPARSETAKV